MARINGIKVDSTEVTSPSSLGELLRSHSAGLNGVGLRVVLSPYEHARLETEADAVGCSVRQYMLGKLNEALVREGKKEIPLDESAYVSGRLEHSFTTMNKATH